MIYELDFYVGFGGDINEIVSYDVGYIYYVYLDVVLFVDVDFLEIYGSISMGSFIFGVVILVILVVSGDGIDFGDLFYLNVDYSFLVGSIGVEMVFYVGYYFGDFIGDDDIIDYGVLVFKDGFIFGFVDNDIDGLDVKVYVVYVVDFIL